MHRTPHKTFISAVIVLSMILTFGAAAPSRADDNDAARALATILGVAIAGVVIKEALDKDKKKKAKVHTHQPKVHHGPKHKHGHGGFTRKSSRNLLPQRCFRSFAVDRGHLQGFGRRCLERHYDYAYTLPRHCLHEIYTDRGYRQVYHARCLRRQGFQLARY